MNEEDIQTIESMIVRHIGVFAEHVNHKSDILIEAHQSLSERIDRQVKELSERIGCVEHKLDMVAAQADRTEKKLDIVAAQADRTEKKLDTVAAQADRTEKKIDAVAAQADRTEKKIDTLEAKLDSVAADLKAHRADTEAHPALYGVKEP